MCSLRKLLFTCFFLSVCYAQTGTKDSIGFPEVEENPDLKNKDNRQPLFSPAMCPDNEWLYPGDQKDDWICDCRPAYLYQPASDKCWAAFRQGPCPPETYLVLPQDSVIPVCENNPCKVDNYVQWNGKCEKLGSIGPCSHAAVPAALGVNATTLVVSCVAFEMTPKVKIETRTTTTTTTTTRTTTTTTTDCPLGYKRSLNGKCVPTTI